jgi:hypothetical protein
MREGGELGIEGSFRRRAPTWRRRTGDRHAHATYHARPALYFPYIEVPDSPSLTRVLLYWDQLRSIVPLGRRGRPRLSDRLSELISLGLVEPVDPAPLLYLVPAFTEGFPGRSNTSLTLRVVARGAISFVFTWERPGARLAKRPHGCWPWLRGEPASLRARSLERTRAEPRRRGARCSSLEVLATSARCSPVGCSSVAKTCVCSTASTAARARYSRALDGSRSSSPTFVASLDPPLRAAQQLGRFVANLRRMPSAMAYPDREWWSCTNSVAGARPGRDPR